MASIDVNEGGGTKNERKASGPIICPNLSLIIDPHTKKRRDGRESSQIRPIYVQTGVRAGVRGSSYLEIGNTKVLSVVNGPHDLPRKVDFSTNGLLSVDIQSLDGKVSDKDIALLKEALEAVVILERFPKCLVEVSIFILEDDGSSISACITAAGLALMEGGIQIYDLPVGTTLGDEVHMDPTKAELETIGLTDISLVGPGGGWVTMGYMPSREQICLLSVKGKMEPQFLLQCLNALTATSSKLLAVLKHQAVQDKMRSNSASNEQQRG